MRRVVAATVLLIVTLSLGFNVAVFAKPSVQQTTQGCPTYQVTLIVDLVNSNPTNPTVGQAVVTRVHVAYNDGTPVTLVPETISFLWTGTSGNMQFDNAVVIFTGEPGFYNYTQPLTQEMLQTLGEGKATISVVECSCSDIRANRGPVSLTDSDSTLTPSDNSHLFIGPQAPAPPQPVAYLVPLAIALLLIIALLLFLMRSRRKKKK